MEAGGYRQNAKILDRRLRAQGAMNILSELHARARTANELLRARE
jgi:hypothetical protein